MSKKKTTSTNKKSKAAPKKEPPPALKPGRAPRTDPRLPAVGTVIRRTYKGKEYAVTVDADGLALDGTTYRSASALAKAVTCYPSVNGMLWLGLTKPGSAAKEPRATAKAKA